MGNKTSTSSLVPQPIIEDVRAIKGDGKDFDYLIKAVSVGDTGVGKTNFMLRCAGDAYSPAYSSTIGVDFKVIRSLEDGLNVKLQLWDVAGPEKFRSISTAYYRGAHGIFLLFSVTDKTSFNSMHRMEGPCSHTVLIDVEHWHQEIERYAHEDVALILVGTHRDKSAARQVSVREAEAKAKAYGIAYYEVSNKAFDEPQFVMRNMIRVCLKMPLLSLMEREPLRKDVLSMWENANN